MIKKICIVCFGIFVFLPSCFAMDVSARSAILYEPQTGTILYEKDARVKREIASTTKIMTAVVVLENSNINDIVTVSKSCVGIEGTSMYLKENERLSVSDLLHGLLLRSGNDAAVALAYHTGAGDVERFVDMMNETAAKIGMTDSCFKNPNGLPQEGHVSTALDMAKLTAYAREKPQFAEIVATKQKSVAGRLLSNHNKLLRMYDGANGVKTGFTKAAGRCLVSSATRNGMDLIAVTLSAPDDWQDHSKLLDYGFENFSLFSSAKEGSAVSEIAVVGGVETIVSVLNSRKVTLLKNKNEKIETQIYLPRFIYAPVSRGDVLGELRYVSNGEVLESVSLVCGDDVKEYNAPGFFDRLLDFFWRK